MCIVCPLCRAVRPRLDHVQVEETWRLMELYYELGDGVAWNAQAHLVTFESRASAGAFKAQAPTWTSQWLPSTGNVGIVP